MSRLTLAIPSKGRLKEQTEQFLEQSGFKLQQSGGIRAYKASLTSLPEVDVHLLSAREIAQQLLSGDIHLGVTGMDLLQELGGPDNPSIRAIKPLGFGAAKLVVAVPQSWLDVSTMSDLEEAGRDFLSKHDRRFRVATKYLNLARRFFARKGVTQYRLVENSGATEAAPAAGAAELIVDITSSGATLKANGLKILDDGMILDSQAQLTIATDADWSADVQQTLKQFLDNITARSYARQYKILRVHGIIPSDMLSEFMDRSGVICNIQNESFSELLCPIEDATRLAGLIASELSLIVSIHAPEFIFQSENPLYNSQVNFNGVDD